MTYINLPQGAVAHFTQEKKSSEILYEVERSIAHSFEQTRLQDFCGGRYCAHQCLSEFDLSEPILKTEHGEPLWPDGVVGSISHSKFLSGAVVMPKSEYKAVGLDIETIGRVELELWSLFFTPNEIDWLRSKPPQYQSFYATLFFSIKEAYFKMQFSITQRFVDFQDCMVTYDAGQVSVIEKVDFVGLPALQTAYSEYQDSVIAMVYC